MEPRDFEDTWKLAHHFGIKDLVVEDVTSTGGQVAISTRALRDREAVVNTVLCVIDRSGGTHPELDELGLRLRPLFTSAELE
jgi:orotate phosphoribosyltransferase